MRTFYEMLFRHVLYPVYESGLRGRRTLAWLREYEASQWLPQDQIAALQWHKLKALLEHCYREVPYYRNLWQSLDIHPDDVRDMHDFRCLPRLYKKDIQQHFEQIKAESLRGQLLYKNTGGSTGMPLRFGYTRESNDRRNAVMWRGYNWAGARMGRRTMYLWGAAVGDLDRVHLFKERIFNAAFNRHMVNSFVMSEARMAGFADAVMRIRPAVIVAYVGPLLRLAEWLLENRRRPFRPQSILAAAEPLHEFQRHIIEQAFGAPVFNTYGCREFMLIASQCEQRHGLHVNVDHLLVETVAGDNNRHGNGTGEITITDLHNYGMPFVRYVNGDLATPISGTCGCGRGLPLLQSIDGRKLDALRSPQGHVLPGEFFPHMLKDVAGLRQYQVVQRELERLHISLVRGDGFDESVLDYIRRETAKVVGDALELQFAFVDKIELGANGKLRVTRCELD